MVRQERMISDGRVGYQNSYDSSLVENKGDVVDVAVAPVLARLGGADDGMADIAGVRGGVLARRVVAAADVPARVAHAQVHPPTAACQALLAASDAVGQLSELDAVEM